MPSDTAGPDERTPAAGPDRAEVIVALSAIALGLLVFVGAFSIDLGTGYDRIGPRFFPYVVAAGLILSGSLLARGAMRGVGTSVDDAGGQTSGRAIGTLSAGLVLSVGLLEPLGFILAAALLFWLVARAFLSRRPGRDAVVGLLLSLFVYFAFTRGLGLVLPRGFLDRLF